MRHTLRPILSYITLGICGHIIYGRDIHKAVLAGDYDAVVSYLDKIETPDTCDKQHRTPLHIAAGDNLFSILSNYDLPNQDNTKHEHPGVYVDIIDKLIEKGASFDEQTIHGKTPLNCAVQVGNTAIAKKLLKNKVIMFLCLCAMQQITDII